MANIINKIKVSGTDYNISTTTTSGLTTNADGAVYVNATSGLTFDENNKLKVNLGGGLTFDDKKIKVNTTSGLTTNADGAVYVNCGNGLTFDENNKLKVNLGDGLTFDNKKIQLDYDSVFIKYLNTFSLNIDSLTSTGIYFGQNYIKIQEEVDCGGGTSGNTSGSTSGNTSGSTSGNTSGSTREVKEECFVVVLTNQIKKTISQLKYSLYENVTLMIRQGTYNGKLENVTWGDWQPFNEFIF